MKVKDLIKKLQKVDGDRNVFIYGEDTDLVDFSGCSYDDENNITLYEVCGDERA